MNEKNFKIGDFYFKKIENLDDCIECVLTNKNGKPYNCNFEFKVYFQDPSDPNNVNITTVYNGKEVYDMAYNVYDYDQGWLIYGESNTFFEYYPDYSNNEDNDDTYVAEIVFNNAELFMINTIGKDKQYYVEEDIEEYI